MRLSTCSRILFKRYGAQPLHPSLETSSTPFLPSQYQVLEHRIEPTRSRGLVTLPGAVSDCQWWPDHCQCRMRRSIDERTPHQEHYYPISRYSITQLSYSHVTSDLTHGLGTRLGLVSKRRALSLLNGAVLRRSQVPFRPNFSSPRRLIPACSPTMNLKKELDELLHYRNVYFLVLFCDDGVRLLWVGH